MIKVYDIFARENRKTQYMGCIEAESQEEAEAKVYAMYPFNTKESLQVIDDSPDPHHWT